MRLLQVLLTLMLISAIGRSQSLDEVLNNKELANEDIYPIMDLDVFTYFNLYQYDSDLKMAVFKKTPEYAEKLSELKIIKSEMLKKEFYVVLNDQFSEGEINYDIKKRGFLINLGRNSAMFGTSSRRAPKSMPLERNKERRIVKLDEESIFLKALPVKMEQMVFLGEVQKGIFNEILFIPVSEESGLEIEENGNDISIYFIFTPSGKETVSYKFYNAGDQSWYTAKDELVKSDKVKVVLANKVTNKVYYDKTFNYQAPTAKPTVKK